MAPQPLSAVTALFLARLYAERDASVSAAEADLRRLREQSDAAAAAIADRIDRLQPNGKERA